MIDITTTATIRPDVLDKTLSSFKSKLFKNYPCRLIINIDPVGEEDKTAEDVLRVAEKYFPVIWGHTPTEPHFGRAFKWCWSQVTSQWVFHLEDDWELLENISLELLLGIMRSRPLLASIRIPWFKASALDMKNWNLWFPWDGSLFMCPHDLRSPAGFCGHPSLLRGDFVRRCTPLLFTETNPEKQFHGLNPRLTAEALQWNYGVYGYPNSPKMLRELGEPWRTANKIKKSTPNGIPKADFITWEKAE